MPPADSAPDFDNSIFRVQLRSGVWGVKLDGAFFGDYHAMSDAMGNVLEKARTLQSAGRTVQIITLSAGGAVLSSRMIGAG
jgi:hypothetical protein